MTLQNYTLTINNSKGVEQMIKEGKYDWVDDRITLQNFPISGSGTQEIKAILVHLGSLSNFMVLDEYKQMGLKPARVEMLLALDTTYPELHKSFPLAVVNPDMEKWDTMWSICTISGGYMLGEPPRRHIGLHHYPGTYCEDCFRFLALPK